VPAQLLDPTPANLAIIAAFVPQTIELSILLTWLILHTRGSILAAAVLHATWNVVGFAFPVTMVEGRALFGMAVLGVAAFVVAIVGPALARRAGNEHSSGFGVNPYLNPGRSDPRVRSAARELHPGLDRPFVRRSEEIRR
jgi:hypothetical protein